MSFWIKLGAFLLLALVAIICLLLAKLFNAMDAAVEENDARHE